MSDIVERLRNPRGWSDKADMLEAAGEITRLRADNERLLAANRDVMLHWDVLRADYEGLRAVMSDAVEWCDRHGKEPHWLDFARAALAAQPAPKEDH